MDPYLQWANMHASHQDVFKKEILESYVEGSSLFLIKDQEKEAYVSIGPQEIERFIPLLKTLLEDHTKVWLVLENAEAKIDEIISYWTFFSSHKQFRFWFVSLTNQKKWALNPSAHAAIVPKQKLKKSLIALQQSI